MQSQLVVKYWCSLDPAWTRHFFRWTNNTSGYSKNCIETCLKGQVNVPICLYKTWRLSCLVPRRHSRVVRVSHSPVCENRSGWGRLRQVTEYYLSRSCITNGGITNTGSGSNTRVKVVSKTAWKQQEQQWLNRACLFAGSLLLSWLSKQRRAKLAWGNSRRQHWFLRNERRNSILMMRHNLDLSSASDWSCRVGNFFQPISSTTQWHVLSMEFHTRFSDVISRENQL